MRGGDLDVQVVGDGGGSNLTCPRLSVVTSLQAAVHTSNNHQPVI